MKSRIFSLLILAVFVSVSAFIMNSCSSSNHAASYPVIHKLKNEKFAKNIKHKNKVRNGDISRSMAQVGEKKTSTIEIAEIEPDEASALPGGSLSEPVGTSGPGPDIASVNNDALYSNYNLTIDDQFFKANYRHYNNPFKTFRKHFLKTKNASEAGNSDHKKGSDSPAFGIVSLTAGVVGLFVPIVLGIILGAVALIFGILGSNRKLKGLAIAGIVLGVLIIILGLVIVASA